MPKGVTKNIADINVGEKVLSYNPTTKQFAYSNIIELFHHPKEERKYLIINGVLKVTPNHPLFVDGSWKEAELLKVGDKLFTGNSTLKEIISIEKKRANVPVYNLRVADNHNYFAGGFLVHNKDVV
jgi:intein/homing endonuclease